MFPIFNRPNSSQYISGNTFLTRPRRKTTGSPLLNGLVAHWSLDEASGPRADATGNHDLTPHGSIVQVEGKLGCAAQFDPDTSDYLSVVSRPGLRVGASDFTIAGWVMFDFVGSGALAGKWETGSLEYLLATDGAYLCFSASADGLAADTASTSAGLDSGPWYHFAAWHDAAGETIYLVINNGEVVSASHAGGIYEGTADFNLGRDGVTGALFSGRLDSISVWKRLLTAGERSQLYNNGAGLAYPF